MWAFKFVHININKALSVVFMPPLLESGKKLLLLINVQNCALQMFRGVYGVSIGFPNNIYEKGL